MTTAAGEASYPVVAGIKWTKSFHAALATPVAVADLVYGLFGWLGIRLLFNLVIYAAIMAAVGAATWGAAMMAVVPATLTGLAFAAPITAWVSTLENDTVALVAVPVRDHAAVPLLRHLLPDRAVARFPRTGCLPVSAVPRCGVDQGRGRSRPAALICCGGSTPEYCVALVVGGTIAAVRNLGEAMRK